MAVINQKELFDKLQKYIDNKIEKLSDEIRDILKEFNLDDIIEHMDEIIAVGQNIYKVVAVGNNLQYVIPVGHYIDSVRQCADNIDDIRNYGDTYYGPLDSDPITRPDGSAIEMGDMYFNTTDYVMRVYANGHWIDAGSPFDAIRTYKEEVATSGQTVFDFVYDVGNVSVHVDGSLVQSTEYDALNGVNVVFKTAMAGGEVVILQSLGTFNVANHYTKWETIQKFALKHGSPFRDFMVNYSTEGYDAVNNDRMTFYLQNYTVRGHNHDTMYYRKDEFADYQTPNVPVKTEQNGKLDISFMPFQTFEIQTLWLPSTTQEYPDITQKNPGDFWIIKFPNDTDTYTFSTGCLAGQTAGQHDVIILGSDTCDGTHTTWLLVENRIDASQYLLKTGDTMVGNLSFGNTNYIKHLPMPQEDTDAATMGYVTGIAADYVRVDGSTPITATLGYSAEHTISNLTDIPHKRYVDDGLDQKSDIDHVHTDYTYINDSANGGTTNLREDLDAKADSTELQAHLDDEANPHNVDFNQVGAPGGTWSLNGDVLIITVTG